MARRTFVSGTLLAAAGVAAWRAGPRAGWGCVPEGEPLPDGRVLVRGAALAFGTSVSVAAVHGDPAAARAAVREALREIREIDALMTVFRPGSEVSRLNAAGALDRPDRRLVHVLEASQRLSATSGGAFDVTVQPLWSLFVASARAGRLPAPEEIARARALVGFGALEVSPRRVRLGRPGMAITLNGVAQGYAADLAVAALRERGVQDALVDAGELGAEGARQPGDPWTIGVRHPRDPAALLGALPMDGRFVATSGDYAAPFSADLRHHHVFDPRTGLSPTLLSSAVVAAATGLEADALTKAMMVLEPARARALLSLFPGAGAVLVDKDGGTAACEGVRLLPVEPETSARSAETATAGRAPRSPTGEGERACTAG